jgi:serpin B
MTLDRRTALGLVGSGLAGGLLWDAATSAVTADAGGPDRRPEATRDAVEAYAHGNAGFGLDLLGELAAAAPETNRMVSPLSVSASLAMTWAGARGETASEMRETLRFPHGRPELHRAVGALHHELGRRADDVPRFEGYQLWETNRFELRLANALWGQSGFPFAEPFLETLERYYGGGLRTADFEGDPEGARRQVNDWAASRTAGRIDDLLPEGSITPMTRLVLANAVYLLADWDRQFDPEETENEQFTAIHGRSRQVRMMEQTDEFRAVFDREAGYRAVELPYVGGDLAMVFVMPSRRETPFREFEAAVDGAWLTDRFAELDAAGERETLVRIPRFEFETGTRLNGPLRELGMVSAFDREDANFDGVVAEGSDLQLYISHVFHDTYVAVDETGTEAAAATGSLVEEVSAPPTFAADRPFLFCVRDRPTDAVLFLGRVVDAAAAAIDSG